MGVLLTERALSHLSAIRKQSLETWGKRVARAYMSDLGAALDRLKEAPGILQERPERSLRLHFYPVREHVLICDVMGEQIYVLAVWHGGMDLPSRLVELEPQLILEAELMSQRIERNQ